MPKICRLILHGAWRVRLGQHGNRQITKGRHLLFQQIIALQDKIMIIVLAEAKSLLLIFAIFTQSKDWRKNIRGFYSTFK